MGTKDERRLSTLYIVYTGTTSNNIRTESFMRTSEYLDRKAIAAIKQAPRTALAIARPLNTFVTISVTQTKCQKEKIGDQFRGLRDQSFHSWARYKPVGADRPRNGPPTFAWVIEAPKDGDDIHWLLHIRPEMQREFAERLQGWVNEWFEVGDWADNPIHIRHENLVSGRTVGNGFVAQIG